MQQDAAASVEGDLLFVPGYGRIALSMNVDAEVLF